VGHQWTFPIHRKKNNTLGLGDYKCLSCIGMRPFWSGKMFLILVPLPILYYSQCLILEQGNNTLYRRELMVWEGWKEHTYCVYILLKVPSNHGTFTMLSWSPHPDSYGWAITASCYERFGSLVDKGATSGGVGHEFKSWKMLKKCQALWFHLIFFWALWNFNRDPSCSINVYTEIFTDICGKSSTSDGLLAILPSASE
jgi:hypothetical protein